MRSPRGWIRDLPDKRDSFFKLDPPTDGLPLKVDLRFGRPPYEPNWDQGELSGCGPFNASELLVWLQMNLGYRRVFTPSRMFIYWITRVIMGTTTTDSGVYIRDMMKALATVGWCEEKLWPWNPANLKVKPPEYCFKSTHKIPEYNSIAQSLDKLKASLSNRQPVIFGFAFFPEFWADNFNGVVPMPRKGETILGYHCGTLMGYNATRFIVRGFYGEKWAMGGDFTMPFDYVLNPEWCSDFWVVTKPGIVGRENITPV